MEKIVSLQALRAIAFIGIFLVHARSPIAWSALGVSIFFVMSGFLMMHLHYNADENITIKKAINFSIKRIKKIYSLHIITMICAIILALVSIIHHGVPIKSILGLIVKIILNVTLLQTWVPYFHINTSLNGVAWYLSVTMFLYFAFPYICRWIKSKDKLVTISIGILVTEVLLCDIWLQFLDSKHPCYIWFMYCFPIFRVADFFVGCCLGKAYHNNKLDKIGHVKGTLLEIAALAITIFVLTFPHNGMSSTLVQAIWNLTTPYILLAVIWVYLFVCSNGLLTTLMTNKLLVFIGNISAHTFLIHYVITTYTNSAVNYFHINMEGFTMVSIISAEMLLTIIVTVLYLKITKLKRKKVIQPA